jgi:beta-glucosidase
VSELPRPPQPDFPADFVWGVATAACQIEGAAALDGKGPSSWDVFARHPGAIFEGHTPEIACDHYHRLEEDLELIRELGVRAYRFSVSWPRVLPQGGGAPNEAGLSFYDRLIEGLLERGVTPYLTIFHWDTPHALEELGGFRNPECKNWFADYTELLARRFGDRVRHWITLNEPHAFIEGGLRQGRHAPGLKLPLPEVLRAAHHALLCHGRAVQILRVHVRDAFVMAAPVLIAASPLTESPEDLEAARRFTFERETTELRVSGFWMDPIYRGEYSESALRAFGSAAPKFPARDLELIFQPLDALGFNLYDTVTVRADETGAPIVLLPEPGCPRTAFGWPVTPEGHFFGPKLAYERYRLPVLITENGLSTSDWVALDGKVHDAARSDFIQRHLEELRKAMQSGVPVLGYFHWSLLDNFEWNHGYRERFGLVHVDYRTLRRTLKDSFFSYQSIVRTDKLSS